MRKVCRACEGWEKPLPAAEADRLLAQVPGWEIREGKVHRLFAFKDFKEAMTFVNMVADLAEREGHHPDITILWNKVTLDLVTHAIKGLSENDFIVAAKTNEIVETMRRAASPDAAVGIPTGMSG